MHIKALNIDGSAESTFSRFQSSNIYPITKIALIELLYYLA